VVNKKIKNATINEIDGIRFRSKLESYAYQRLKEAGLLDMVEYEPYKITLFNGFSLYGKKYNPITWTPDFVVKYKTGENVFFELKGYPNDAWPIKRKMIQRWILGQYSGICNGEYREYELIIAKNKKDVDKFIKELINNNERVDEE
jgi:hypothetical protein